MTLYCQPKDSNSVCLTIPQFKFYATTLIKFNGLKIDTFVLNDQIRIQGAVMKNLGKQLGNCELSMLKKDEIIRADTIAFNKLAKDYRKSDKKIKRLKQTSLSFVIISAILGFILVLK